MSHSLSDKPLQVIRRPLLVKGMLGTAPGRSAVILVGEGQSRPEEAVTLWHELIHLLKMAGGDDQDEEMIEQAAKHLATLYPEIRKWVGLHHSDGK